jgi:VCBS repeat-containing protein
VLAAAGLLTNASDPENDTLSVSGNTQPAHGSLDLQEDGSFEYTPNETYSGQDIFNYTVTDGIAFTTAAVIITISEFSGRFDRQRWRSTARCWKSKHAASLSFCFVSDQSDGVGLLAEVLRALSQSSQSH